MFYVKHMRFEPFLGRGRKRDIINTLAEASELDVTAKQRWCTEPRSKASDNSVNVGNKPTDAFSTERSNITLNSYAKTYWYPVEVLSDATFPRRNPNRVGLRVCQHFPKRVCLRLVNKMHKT